MPFSSENRYKSECCINAIIAYFIQQKLKQNTKLNRFVEKLGDIVNLIQKDHHNNNLIKDFILKY